MKDYIHEHYAIMRSSYGLLRNHHINYRMYVMMKARREYLHKAPNFSLHRRARKHLEV